MSSSITIRISRNQDIAKDRSIAILQLNKAQHFLGQPIMVKYYSDSSKTKIDTILALGTKDGIGEDCYKVISLGGLELVRQVVDTIPPISLLIHGELYLYRDQENKWNYVYEKDSERVVEPIESMVPTTFICIEDKYRWFWDGKILKREDDFYSGEEMAYLMDEMLLIIGPPKLEVRSSSGYLFQAGQTVNIPLQVKIEDSQKNNITKRCKFYIDGIETTLRPDDSIVIPEATVTKDYLIEARATSYLGKTYSYSCIISIEFGHTFYYGPVNEDWVLSEENLVNLENKVIQSRRTIEYTGINLEYKKLVFSYPEQYGELMHIYDEHGLEYIEDNYLLYKQKLGDKTYNVYILTDAITIGDFEQIYMFEETDKDEEQPGIIDEEKYDEVLKAWDLKNTSTGLVVTNENGKIPSDLIQGLNFTSDYSLINLVCFLDDYPDKVNLTVGQKWYITSEKTIFEATSNNSGNITSPELNTLYVNNATNSIYTWSGEDMELLGESISSAKINNIADILD